MSCNCTAAQSRLETGQDLGPAAQQFQKPHVHGGILTAGNQRLSPQTVVFPIIALVRRLRMRLLRTSL